MAVKWDFVWETVGKTAVKRKQRFGVGKKNGLSPGPVTGEPGGVAVPKIAMLRQRRAAGSRTIRNVLSSKPDVTVDMPPPKKGGHGHYLESSGSVDIGGNNNSSRWLGEAVVSS
jgi:hypothetical protein